MGSLYASRSAPSVLLLTRRPAITTVPIHVRTASPGSIPRNQTTERLLPMAYSLSLSEEPRYLLLNLFPADIAYGARSTPDAEPFERECRVIVTDSTLYAIRAGLDAPEAFIQADILPESFQGSPKGGYDIETTSGEHFYITRSSGCGCGSFLRGVNPFPFAPYNRKHPLR